MYQVFCLNIIIHGYSAYFPMFRGSYSTWFELKFDKMAMIDAVYIAVDSQFWADSLRISIQSSETSIWTRLLRQYNTLNTFISKKIVLNQPVVADR